MRKLLSRCCFSFIEYFFSIDYEAVVKLTDGFNGADLRNVVSEAGMFAIRATRTYVTEEDFMKAARKVAETKVTNQNSFFF